MQVIGQNLSQVSARIDEDMFGSVALTEINKTPLEFVKCPKIVRPEIFRPGNQFVGLFKPNELGWSCEFKSDFVMMEDLKKDHLMPMCADLLDGFFQLCQVRKKVADDDDNLPSLKSSSQLGETLRHPCFSNGLGHFNVFCHPDNLSKRVAWWHKTSDFIVEGGE